MGLFLSRSHLLQFLKCFLRVSTCLPHPLLWLLCLDSKWLGTLRVQGFLCRCRLWPQSPAHPPSAGHVPQMPTVRTVQDTGHTVLAVGVSSAQCNTTCVTHTHFGVTHRAQDCSRDPGNAPVQLLSTATRVPRATPDPAERLAVTSRALSPTFHPTRNFRPREPPARRSHVPMSPRGPSTLPCHAGYLLAGGLAALGPRSASQASHAHSAALPGGGWGWGAT